MTSLAKMPHTIFIFHGARWGALPTFSIDRKANLPDWPERSRPPIAGADSPTAQREGRCLARWCSSSRSAPVSPQSNVNGLKADRTLHGFGESYCDICIDDLGYGVLG